MCVSVRACFDMRVCVYVDARACYDIIAYLSLIFYVLGNKDKR